MSGRSTSEVSAERRRDIWRMHDRGMTQRAISRRLGISLSTVQHFLKDRPTTDPLTRPTNGRGSGSAAAKTPDTVIPGSVRTERTEHARELMTIRCGGCGCEFEVSTFNHTTRCKRCGRVCRFGTAAAAAAENVIPIRRTS